MRNCRYGSTFGQYGLAVLLGSRVPSWLSSSTPIAAASVRASSYCRPLGVWCCQATTLEVRLVHTAAGGAGSNASTLKHASNVIVGQFALTMPLRLHAEATQHARVAPAELQQFLPDQHRGPVGVGGALHDDLGDVDPHRAATSTATRAAVAAEGDDRLRTGLAERVPRAGAGADTDDRLVEHPTGGHPPGHAPGAGAGVDGEHVGDQLRMEVGLHRPGGRAAG